MSDTDPESKPSANGKPQPEPASKPDQPRVISKQVFTDFAAI